ncbi:MAG: hypothetical protein WHT09_10295 [Thermogutta sp.]|nr:hypothetical protein [Thermogutta terrifontis]
MRSQSALWKWEILLHTVTVFAGNGRRYEEAPPGVSPTWVWRADRTSCP